MAARLGAFAGVLFFGLVATGFGQIRKTSAGYDMSALYRRGEVRKYIAGTQIQGLVKDKAIQLSFPTTLKVISSGSGVSQLRVSFGTPQSGDAKLSMKILPRTMKVDRRNKTIGTSQGAQMVMLFPNHPVKVGETWTGTSSIVLGTGQAGEAIGTTYTFKGVRVDRGRHIAMVGMSLHGFAHGEGTTLLDCADGSVLASTLDLEISANAQASYPVQVVLKRL